MEKEEIDNVISNHYNEIRKMVIAEYKGDIHSTEDMIQDCVLHLYSTLPKFNSDKSKLSTFIYGSCVNKIKNKVKPRKNTIVYSDAQDELEDKVEEINEDFFKIVSENFITLEDSEYLFISSVLTEKEFEIFTAYTRRRMTYPDIANYYKLSNGKKAERLIKKYTNKVKKAWDKTDKKY